MAERAEAGGVLVVGALHHDLIVRAPYLPAPDETVMGTGVDTVCGGKGGNQAVAAARMGARTAFAGRIGLDEAGRAMRAHLERAGVDISGLQSDARECSGMSVAIVRDDGEYGAVVVSGANRAIEPEAIAIPEGTAVLVLQNEVPDAVNTSVARRAKDAGATLVWNAAPYRPGTAGLRALCDVLVVNRVEASALLGLSEHDLASPLMLTGALASRDGLPPATIVTLGADGCVVVEVGRAPHHVPPARVEPVSSHGAGDVFVGALAARLAAHADATLEEAAAFASRAAAVWVASDLPERDGFSLGAVERYPDG